MTDLKKFFKGLKHSENSRRGGIKGAAKTNVLQAPYLTPFKKEVIDGKKADTEKLTNSDIDLLIDVLNEAGWKFISIQDERLVISKDGGKTTYHWNPLSDPADAMELAVNFELLQDHRSRWSCVRYGKVQVTSCCVPAENRTPMQAACRAITVCVAELWRSRHDNFENEESVIAEKEMYLESLISSISAGLFQEAPYLKSQLIRLVQSASELECLKCAAIVQAQDVDPGFKRRIAQGILNRHFSE